MEPKAKKPELGESPREITAGEMTVFLTILIGACAAALILPDIFKVPLSKASEWVMLAVLPLLLGLLWRLR